MLIVAHRVNLACSLSAMVFCALLSGSASSSDFTCDLSDSGYLSENYAVCESYYHSSSPWDNNAAQIYKERATIEQVLQTLAETEPLYPGYTLGSFAYAPPNLNQYPAGGISYTSNYKAAVYNSLGDPTNQTTSYSLTTWACQANYRIAYVGAVNYQGDAIIHPGGCALVNCPAEHAFDYLVLNPSCQNQDKNLGVPISCPVGSPINIGVGNNYLRQEDRAGTGYRLSFVRTYNAFSDSDAGSGRGWLNNYQRHLAVLADRVIIIDADGGSETFLRSGGGWSGDSGTQLTVADAPTGSGYSVSRPEGTIEHYDASGRLGLITDIAGNTLSLSYDVKRRLERVENNTGDYLQLSYDTSNHLSTVTDSASRTWTYHYDADDNLTSVDNPDGTTKQYHYNEHAHTANTDLPHALTGITDERGIRYATFAYQADGRAVASMHAGDAQRVDISYNDTNGTRTVTDSLGHASTYSTAVQLGVALVTGIDGPGCTSCGGSDTDYLYDPATNGLLEKTANGITTKYGNYDAKGQKGCVTEGIDASDSSTGACAFDPAVSPDARRTDYTYDGRFHGKVTTVTEYSVYQP